MLKYLFLIVFMTSNANGQLAFTWSNFGPQPFSITCSGDEISSNSIKHPMSIVISRTDGNNNYLEASQSAFQTDNTFTNSTVTGSFIDVTQSIYPFLKLTWNEFTPGLEGTYLCILYGLGTGNTPSSLSQQLTVKKEDLNPTISTRPVHIIDGLTKTLIVECTWTRAEDWFEPYQIDLFQSYTGSHQTIASVSYNGSNGIVTVTQNEWSVVNNYFIKGKAASLEMSRRFPTTIDSGLYTCDFIAVQNGSSKITHNLRSTNVTVSVATKQEVYDKNIGDEDLEGYFLFACNFEYGLCGFNLSASDSVSQWSLTRAFLPVLPLDHTLRDGSGHYIALNITVVDPNKNPTFKTKVLPPIGRSFSVSFWIITGVSGDYPGCEITKASSNGHYIEQQAFHLAKSQTWNQVRTNVNAVYEPFTLEFNFYNVITIFIDDFAISDISYC